SCGHSSLTQYIQLFYYGLLELDDLEHFRQWGSRTPGHPEHGHTAGVETTTGPLGQGVANAVGMAMAARRERGLLDPDAPEGRSPFDHHVYAICSDGDLEEGVSGEASSLAGHQQLGNLTMIYDDNEISIEGDTDIAFSEDVAKRYEAYGWHVQTVDWTNGGKEYVEDVDALWAALEAAEQVSDKPSMICLRTVIAWPAPNAQGTGASHGSALGEDEVAATKKILGFDPVQTFEVPDDVVGHTRGLVERGKVAAAGWRETFDAWAAANPEGKALLDRMQTRTLPRGWDDNLPTFDADPKGVATRKASGGVLSAIAPALPELWGGSADLAESNNTTPKGEPSFVPEERSTKDFSGDKHGRVLHFGIREHAMGSIMNGIALHGGTRVYGGTFLVFSDYMRPAVRLAALMQLPVTYVWTHDSIGLGEDGPTHQPVEHLAALRAIPGLDVVRPADANETVAAWKTVLEHNDRPAGLALTRQNVPVFPRGTEGFATTEGVSKGGYVLIDAEGGTPDVVLVATGSEVQLAVEARAALAEKGVHARVVSMPCREWFDAQDQSYRDSVIPPIVKARVSVEAGVAQGWREIVGDHGRIVSLEHFGASADFATIFQQFGITAEAVVLAAEESIRAANG
ncbi:MAG: transketolase, partial [Nocardioidaceae bacterium]